MISRIPFLTALVLTTAAWLIALCGSAAAQSGVDKALGRPASASSVERAERRGNCAVSKGGCVAANATDGDARTRWGADWVEGQWWQVDLERPRAVDAVRLSWEYSFPKRYLISTSLDGATYTQARVVQPAFATLPIDLRTEYVEISAFTARLARFVRVTSLERFWPQWGISLWDARVTGPADAVLAPSAPVPPVAVPAPVPSPSAPAPSTPAPSASPAPPTPPPTPPGSSSTSAGGAVARPIVFESAGAEPAGSTPTSAPSTPAPSTPAPSRVAPRPAKSPAAARPRLLLPFPIVRIRGTAVRGGASIEFISVRAPRDARIRVVCRGAGCPQRVIRRRGSGRVPRLKGFLRAGTIVEVFVTRPGRLGKYTRFTVRDRAAPPLRRDGCATDGATRPTACG